MLEEIVLWPDGAPGSEGWTQTERVVNLPDGEPRVVNVTTPTLTPVIPDGPRPRSAVVVAPGGGFRMLSTQSEGEWVANWFAERGVAAYVLKYRLVDTGPTDADLERSFADAAKDIDESGGDFASDIRRLASADAAQAVRYLRSTGAETVGIVGFSAGGFVATDLVAIGESDARPDFVAPIYGASVPDPLPGDAPPFFSMVCADDPLCFDVCLASFRSWRNAGHRAEIHVYDRGGHGFGLRAQGLPVDSWIDRLGDWLQLNGWM